MIIEHSLNHEDYLTMPIYLRSEEKRIEVCVDKISNVDGKNAIQVDFVVASGNHKGKKLSQRYYLDGPSDGKKGSLWVFRRLIIACGLFTVGEDGGPNVGARLIDMPFMAKSLIGRLCIVDTVINGKYLNVTNETYPEDLISGDCTLDKGVDSEDNF